MLASTRNELGQTPLSLVARGSASPRGLARRRGAATRPASTCFRPLGQHERCSRIYLLFVRQRTRVRGRHPALSTACSRLWTTLKSIAYGKRSAALGIIAAKSGDSKSADERPGTQRRSVPGHVINFGFLIGNHMFRATGITQDSRNGGGGGRELAQQHHDWNIQSTSCGVGGSAHRAESARQRGPARALRIGGLQPGFLAPAAVRRAYDGVGHQHPLGTRISRRRTRLISALQTGSPRTAPAGRST